MRRSLISRCLAVAFAALSAVSCIFPFKPEPEDESGTLVIEGDILIGNYSTVSLEYTSAMSTPTLKKVPVGGRVWVEDDAGRIYPGTEDAEKPGTFTVDTRSAKVGPQYRLCVQNGETGREYYSLWEEALPAPVIDSLSYILNYDRAKLDVAISMHAQNSSYFRWRYTEDWEYHSVHYARLKYIPPSVDRYGRPTSNGQLVLNDEDTYVCWSHKNSTEIMIFSTENQTDDRFVDLEFHTLAQTDVRISQAYRIEVTLHPLTRDAYLYWDNIKTNSEYGGDLFSPTPSEMVGNIRCAQDPDERVIGYVSVAEPTSKHLYVLNKDNHFYDGRNRDESFVELGPSQWYDYYKDGYLPYDYYRYGDISDTYWAPERCVDCRLNGGTNQEPDFWLKD